MVGLGGFGFCHGVLSLLPLVVLDPVRSGSPENLLIFAPPIPFAGARTAKRKKSYHWAGGHPNKTFRTRTGDVSLCEMLHMRLSVKIAKCGSSGKTSLGFCCFGLFPSPAADPRWPRRLGEFIDRQSAFLAQKKDIYEYARARAGHYAKVSVRRSGLCRLAADQSALARLSALPRHGRPSLSRACSHPRRSISAPR